MLNLICLLCCTPQNSLNVSLYEYTYISLTLRNQQFAHYKNILNIILLESLTIRDIQITGKCRYK